MNIYGEGGGEFREGGFTPPELESEKKTEELKKKGLLSKVIAVTYAAKEAIKKAAGFGKEEKEEEVERCLECGTALIPGVTKCPYCGTRARREVEPQSKMEEKEK